MTNHACLTAEIAHLSLQKHRKIKPTPNPPVLVQGPAGCRTAAVQLKKTFQLGNRLVTTAVPSGLGRMLITFLCSFPHSLHSPQKTLSLGLEVCLSAQSCRLSLQCHLNQAPCCLCILESKIRGAQKLRSYLAA
jgi:hypothetical protein